MTIYFLLKTVLLLVTLILALYYDIRQQKVKNFITIPAALMGLLINSIENGSRGLILSIGGWLVPVLLLIILYYINVMGAGDIKLYAAIGAIMGLPFVLYCFIYSVYFGGLIAVFLLIKRKEFLGRMKKLFNYFTGIVYTLRLSPYCQQDDHTSKFIFTSAIVPGAILELVLTLINIKAI